MMSKQYITIRHFENNPLKIFVLKLFSSPFNRSIDVQKLFITHKIQPYYLRHAICDIRIFFGNITKRQKYGCALIRLRDFVYGFRTERGNGF
jgi:hypothetical protein